MPISTTAKSASCGSRARVIGTPQWLLKLASAAWTLPNSASISRSISLVEVLPADPVTAITRARVRARPAAPSAVRPASTSGTTRQGPVAPSGT